MIETDEIGRREHPFELPAFPQAMNGRCSVDGVEGAGRVGTAGFFGRIGTEHAFLPFPIAGVFGNGDGLIIEIDACDIHCGGDGHGERDEILNLLEVPMLVAEEAFHGPHFFLRAAWETGDKIGHQILFFAHLLADLKEGFHEGLKIPGWFAHAPENGGFEVFGRDLEVSGYVVGDELAEVVGGMKGNIHADPRLNEHVLDTRLAPGFTEEPDRGLLIDLEMGAEFGPEATGPVTAQACVGVTIAGSEKIRGGPSQIRYRAMEILFG